MSCMTIKNFSISGSVILYILNTVILIVSIVAISSTIMSRSIMPGSFEPPSPGSLSNLQPPVSGKSDCVSQEQSTELPLGKRLSPTVADQPVPPRNPLRLSRAIKKPALTIKTGRSDDWSNNYHAFSANPWTASNTTPGWQQSEIPLELSTIKAGTPNEITKIVRDSISHCRALRVSTIEARNLPALPEAWQSTEVPTMSPKASEDSQSTCGSMDGQSRFSDVHHSQESVTSAESMATANSHKQKIVPLSEQISRPVPELSETGVVPERLSRKHGFMRLLLGKGSRTHAIKQDDGFGPPTPPKSSVTSTLSHPKECASCFDDVALSVAISLGCQHFYCSGCFSQLIRTAMQNENFWPPKCCLQDIPKKTLEKNLTPLEYANYKLKAKEYSTPAGERWYCARPECGKWFCPSRYRSSDATMSCTHCNHRMCLFCRNSSHAVGQQCPQDKGLNATLAAAELEGWRRCYNCHTMVELGQGCRHITCKCKAEFWYDPPTALTLFR